MTRPIRVPTRFERIARLTVWHPMNTSAEDVDRWGPRFWYPTYDLIAVWLGLYAIDLGSPLLNRLFPDWVTNAVGVMLVISALTCFVGVVIPKLALLELAGKMGIVFILGAYAGTVAFRSNSNEPNGFVVIVLVMAVYLLGPRISVLFARVPAIVTRWREKRAIIRALKEGR
jgi:hypothetical protein